jgi:hypothetical protein
MFLISDNCGKNTNACLSQPKVGASKQAAKQLFSCEKIGFSFEDPP